MTDPKSKSCFVSWWLIYMKWYHFLCHLSCPLADWSMSESCLSHVSSMIMSESCFVYDHVWVMFESCLFFSCLFSYIWNFPYKSIFLFVPLWTPFCTIVLSPIYAVVNGFPGYMTFSLSMLHFRLVVTLNCKLFLWPSWIYSWLMAKTIIMDSLMNRFLLNHIPSAAYHCFMQSLV
jgi:hypothetical protein